MDGWLDYLTALKFAFVEAPHCWQLQVGVGVVLVAAEGVESGPVPVTQWPQVSIKVNLAARGMW